MPALLAFGALLALILIGSGIGFTLRRSAARARRPRHTRDLPLIPLGERGERATFVLFTTRFCAQCPGVRRTLEAIRAAHDGVAIVEIDLTENAALAARLHILQTPTTFVLDDAGTLVARFGGATPRGAFEAEMRPLWEDARV